MSEATSKLYDIVDQSQQRYVYFLLAIAAASIAFAVSQTNGLPLSKSQIPLGLAVLLWSGSFFAGCRNRLFHASAIRLNFELLKVRDGAHELAGKHPQKMAIGADFLKEEIKKAQQPVMRYGRWQFWLYVFGSISFILWHVYEMWLRT